MNSERQVDLVTERLLLRRWLQEDREPFARLNADPLVTRFLPAPIDRDQSDRLIERIESSFAEHGYGLWALEIPTVTPFAGFVGLIMQTFPAHFTPAVEIGWRLASEHWGHGYATEAAHVALAHAHGPLGIGEVVSMTVVANTPSRRVMERIGMVHDPADDFDHPLLPEGDPLRRHVLYRHSVAV